MLSSVNLRCGGPFRTIVLCATWDWVVKWINWLPIFLCMQLWRGCRMQVQHHIYWTYRTILVGLYRYSSFLIILNYASAAISLWLYVTAKCRFVLEFFKLEYQLIIAQQVQQTEWFLQLPIFVAIQVTLFMCKMQAGIEIARLFLDEGETVSSSLHPCMCLHYNWDPIMHRCDVDALYAYGCR